MKKENKTNDSGKETSVIDNTSIFDGDLIAAEPEPEYNSAFVEKIKRGLEQARRGEGVIVDLENLWK
ncbi:MAG: hypothetical protein IJQ94_03595 [Bacteroidales bacterium]|nr:hypothetical protein [Bacteroidales bacterium]